MLISVLLVSRALVGAENNAIPTFPEGIDGDAAFLARISGLFRTEDPTSLYSFTTQDKEVEFILNGTWEAKLESALTLTYNKDDSAVALTPPVFSQNVDLSSWVFIDKTWYFESNFAEKFTKNTVAAGYIGKEDSVIKHVRIGNSGIAFPDYYPFVHIGGGTALAPGIMGTFSGDMWNADTIVRYDTASSRELVLSGMNEVRDEFVSVTNLVQNKWFVLPDTLITGSVSVYLQSDTGTITDSKGRHWRELDVSEFHISGIDGIIELVSEATGSVAVVYQGTYGSGTTPDVGLTTFIAATRTYFSLLDIPVPNTILDTFLPVGAERFLLSLNGETALLLSESGYFSPFSLSSRYSVSGKSPEIVFESSGVSPSFLAASMFDSRYAEVYRTDSAIPGSGTDAIRSEESRFPLANEYPLLYFPSNGGQKLHTDLAIRSRGYQPITTISLGSEVIAGTIVVTRNNIQDTAFRFDESSGLLSLEKNPGATENIRITWLDTDASERNAALTLAGGVRWKPLSSLSLSAAMALQWNIAKSGFTDYADGSPGSVIVSTEISHEGKNLNASTAVALDVSVSDTTGFYRILGMENSIKTFYPTALWFTATPTGFEPVLAKPFDSSLTPVTLSALNRISLEGTNGTTLRTLSDSSVSGSILVMEGNLPASGSWMSAEILTGTLGSADFKSAKTVSLAIKNVGTTNDFDIYLQVGTGDSVYYEDAETVRTWKLQSTPVAGSSWEIKTITLTDDDRLFLASGTNMRVIVIPSSSSSPTPANPVSVKLYTGPIEITESNFNASALPSFTGTGSVSVSEKYDSTTPSLAIVQSSLIQRFNSGGINTILESQFTSDVLNQSITLSKNIPSLPLSHYKYLSFFINPAIIPVGTGSMHLTFSRPSSSGTGVDNAIDLDLVISDISGGWSPGWQKITIDLTNKTVSRNGTALPVSSATITTINRSIQPTQIALSYTNWPITTPYTVYLDEFYLEETEKEYTIRNESAISWKKNGDVLSAGKTAIISDPSIAVTVRSSSNTATSTPVISGTAETGFTVLTVHAEGGVTASNTKERIIESTNHSISIPLGPIAAGETFTIDFNDNTFKRQNSISLSGPLSALTTTHVQMTGRNLERGLSFRLSPIIPSLSIGQFSFSVSSTFFQTGNAKRITIADTAWSDIWKDSLYYSLSTGEADASGRTGKNIMHLGWTSAQAQGKVLSLSGINVDTEASSSYASILNSTLSSTISFSLSTPIKIGITTVTPLWQRTVNQNRSTTKGGSYFSDFDFLSESFREQSWLYTTSPFYDLFDPDIYATIQDTECYSRLFSNRYGLVWKRPSPGQISDLYLPSSLDTSISRITETAASANNVINTYSAQIKAGFSALNMAGSYGVLHIFPWYEQDEISQIYGWNSKWGSSYFIWSMDSWHSLLLFFNGTGTLVAENAFHYDSPTLSSIYPLRRNTFRILWKRPGTDSIISLAAQKWTRLPLSTKREDSVMWGITVTDTNAITIGYNHLLRTGIGSHGEIQLNGGTDYSQSGTGYVTIQFRFGISGKILF